MKKLVFILIASLVGCTGQKSKLVEIEKRAKDQISLASSTAAHARLLFDMNRMRLDSFSNVSKRCYSDSVDGQKLYDSCEFELKKY